MNAQHWQLYVTRADSAVHSRDRTGQLCTPKHSSGLLHEGRITRSPPTQHQASLAGIVPPNTHPADRPPPLPPSTRPALCLH